MSLTDVRASVLRQEDTGYGEARLRKTVARTGERWRFGIEPTELASFLAAYGFAVSDHKNAKEMKDMYFRDGTGGLVGRINAAHRIALAVRM